MKKDKAKRHQRQRQMKALKDARRRAAMRKPPPRPARPPSAPLDDVQLAFWQAHGINYLISDYAAGTWTPLFDGIYEGRFVTKDDVVGALAAKYGTDGGKWPLEAKASFAWLLQSGAIVGEYARAAVKTLKDKHPDADAEALVLQPHNGTVWGLFDSLKKQIVKRGDA